MNDLYCWETKFESCDYSNRLLSKVLLLNAKVKEKIDITEIKKAIYYARKYHGTQQRQTGEPYYSHPIEVAYQIADYAFNTDVLVTSILHDTLEDTKLTKEMIGYIFGLTIANNVEDLTRIKLNQKISSAEIIELLYKQRKNDLLTIKIFDRLHNLQTINIKSEEKIQETIIETLQRFLTASIYCGFKDVEKQIHELCRLHLYTPATETQILQGENRVFVDGFLLLSPVFRNKIIQKYSQILLVQ
ncbi:MAG: HD domain-containing protein [Gammaproteobacteria bacterium]|jgi:(p)ppGpp synthase/HD superfamily hydrolase